MTGPEQVVVLLPERGNVFYRHLARRLATACELIAPDVRLTSTADIGAMDYSWLRQSIALVVCPAECMLSGDGTLRRLNQAMRVVAVAAESAKTVWYSSQFGTLDHIDAFCDIGFIDQSRWNPVTDVPYHFVFNAALDEERARLRNIIESERSLDWALIAHMTPERARLANQLLIHLGSAGFLFLPTLRPVRPGEGMLSPGALHRVLRETFCYVWRSHHTHPYYESFRFLDAVLAGAAPCKIDAETDSTLLAIPNVYPSVEALAKALEDRTATSLFDESRSFYLDQGTLSSHLEDLLRNV
jgi:hypothetical protein